MTTEQLESIVAALAVKAELPVCLNALINGLPRRHETNMTPQEAADFILKGWATGQSETQILERRPPVISEDRFREDLP